MADYNYFGEFAFADVVSRDRAAAIFEDWLQSTAGTEPYEGAQVTGVQVYNNLDVQGTIGPALRFSFRCDEAALQTTGPLSDRIDALALGGVQGSELIT